jgi:hypothetical protein
MRVRVQRSVGKPAATAPRSRSRPSRAQVFSSSRGVRPGMGRAFRPRRPCWASVAAQRQTLARLTPSCRAIWAWESRPCRNSAAAARRRSSSCSDVNWAGRQTLSSIALLLTRTDTALCYTLCVKIIRRTSTITRWTDLWVNLETTGFGQGGNFDESFRRGESAGALMRLVRRIFGLIAGSTACTD